MVLFKNNKFVSESESEDLSLLQSGFGKKGNEGVILHPLEAAYICDLDLLEVKAGKKKIDVKQILSKMKLKVPKLAGKIPNNEEQYLIYKTIRSGGRVVRFNAHSPQFWRVHARGVGREQEKAQTLLRLITSSWKADVKTLERELCVARQLRQEMVFGFVAKKKVEFIKLSKISLA